MGKAIIITMINYKGGVGKTTSVFNFCAGLNYLCDKRVLMIDLDPQCSLTNICLKSYSRKISKEVKIENLKINQTVNHIFKEYLKQVSLSIEPHINLNELIMKRLYRGYYNKDYSGLDLIPTTMFDYENSSYAKGLDDLEIEIARQFFGPNTLLSHITILAKFFKSSNIEKEYDFIFLDCPPANSLITQNALVVSDYYLIPSIMDDMSSYGISHMHNLIQNTIFRQLKELYKDLLDTAPGNTYLDFLKKESPKLLGIFETLRKTGVNTDDIRRLVRRDHKLFKTVIFNHIDTARTTSEGMSCFSVDIKKDEYSPHVCYGKLVAEGLTNMNYSFNNELLETRMFQYY
jgi:cellulose biosynthesis protein BcsQ